MLKRISASPKRSTRSDFEEPPPSIGLGVLSEPDEPDPKRLGGLVLARRLNQVIVIGPEVELQVVGLKVNAVRLMFTAPLSTPIHRLEVFEASQAARRAETSDAPAAMDAPSPPKGRGKLVLTRRVGEKVMIGDEIHVEVAEIRGGTVRLRVIAPREIAVDRQEIRDAIRRGESGRRDRAGDFPS
jgi:carbon storage regulator